MTGIAVTECLTGSGKLRSQQILVFASILLIGAAGGCDTRQWSTPELGQVRGKLTLNGDPLENVMLMFEPDEGKESMATSRSDGTFTAMYFVDLEGVKVGRCTVRVLPGIKGDLGYVPPRYSSESELVFEVTPGENVFDIDLSSD